MKSLPHPKNIVLGILTPIIALSFIFGVILLSKSQSSSGAELANVTDFSGAFDVSAQQAYFDGEEVNSPMFTRDFDEDSTQVLGLMSNSEKWIEVDLSEQKLKAWNGNSLFLESAVSTGLPNTPTPTGEFYIWLKLRYTKMEGGRGKNYYYLPNVPYTMFFENSQVPGWEGYGLHGTYWHSSFGTPRSHGCVNLPTPVAEQIYNWVQPVVSEGKGSVQATDGNPGTRIVIHE